jgi:hypothetical protein
MGATDNQSAGRKKAIERGNQGLITARQIATAIARAGRSGDEVWLSDPAPISEHR